MQQDKPTINLTVPTGWDKLDDHQLRYVFGLLAQGFPSPQVKTYCLFRWTGMQINSVIAESRRSFLRGKIVPVLPQNLRLSECNVNLV